MIEPDYYTTRLAEIAAAKRAMQARKAGEPGAERWVSLREAAVEVWQRIAVLRGSHQPPNFGRFKAQPLGGARS